MKHKKYLEWQAAAEVVSVDRQFNRKGFTDFNRTDEYPNSFAFIKEYVDEIEIRETTEQDREIAILFPPFLNNLILAHLGIEKFKIEFQKGRFLSKQKAKSHRNFMIFHGKNWGLLKF